MTKKILIGIGVIAIIWAIWYFGFKKKNTIQIAPSLSSNQPDQTDTVAYSGPSGELGGIS